MLHDNAALNKGQPGRSKIWQAALYIRLSREDGDKEESDSVVNQRELLLQYVKLESDIRTFGIYIDDGWSGTNFDRPEFRRMIADIESRSVNCVIVKDLSRFGRNYIDVGQYIEKIFPMMDIRFISVTDSLDSFKSPQTMNNIMVPFKNLINDEYCRDISNKVRSSLDMKRKQGKHIGSFACYGYLKDPEDHNHLIPDPVAGEVVKDIFRWFIAGNSILGIAKKLNLAGLPSPSRYKQQLGLHYKQSKDGASDGLWSDSSVRRILTNRMYTGDLVQGVNKVKSYKLQISQRQKEENWIIVEGTHAALISRQEFETVSELLKKRARTAPQQQKVHLFSGYLRCADCGKAMNRKLISHPYGSYSYYICSTFKKQDKSACTKHSLRSDQLEEMVLAAIQSQIALAVDTEKAIESLGRNEAIKRRVESLHKALSSAIKEESTAEELMLELYPDWKSGAITKDEYAKLKARFELQRDKARASALDLERRIAEAQQCTDPENQFVKSFIEHRNIQKLTREVIVALIDVIHIYEDKAIKIDFKYRNPFKDAMEYIASNQALPSASQSDATNTA